ncbi:MAG TPA: sigma-70 family RNA polymerase sigma factor [Nannocystaceae bacterium]|nr:sigma-70 family RNA polymerase sigma factor [Nannocystaceae bacterium]
MDASERRVISTMMARLADGDRDAFAPLFDRLWPLVRAFAGRVLGHDADADDVAQRALVSVFARASEYDPARDGVAWALGIAGWECRTVRRRAQRRRETGDAVELASAMPSPEDVVITADILGAFDAVAGTLTPDDRAALGLGDDEPDIAPATLRKRRQRALVRLRHAWSRLHGSR